MEKCTANFHPAALHLNMGVELLDSMREATGRLNVPRQYRDVSDVLRAIAEQLDTETELPPLMTIDCLSLAFGLNMEREEVFRLVFGSG